ncbi:MAG: nitroreductase family protein [Candidatus Dadabacteria bacterium]|nr:nitroreductase family protein [Candidatus Dadabacteria bacterium]MCY4262668.1 nitroreductase family protein [Candidatus Dadabacteria bacterium]
MKVYECVTSLSSIRSYVDRKVPRKVVMEVMEAGRMAPSAHNSQPWEFVLVDDRKMLREMGQYCTSGTFIAQVAFAVVLLVDPRSKWHQIDGTRAAQNMVLVGWSHGLGSCWIGRIEKEELKEYLALPEGLDILTVLPFGYFDKRLISAGKSRKSPDEVFHLNGYGKGNLR